MGGPAGGDFSMTEHRSVAAVYYLAGIFGVLGNSITILIFWREKAISGTRGRLHIQIALANIMVVIGSFFSGTSAFFGRWLFGSLGCQIYGLETYTGGMAAVTLAAMLCYQRMFAQSSADKYDRSSASGMLLTVGWLYSLVVAIGPLVGWNSYVIESAGTACGLNWQRDDWSHNSMFIILPVINTVFLLSAILSVRSALGAQGAEKAFSSDWFTNNQLNWIAVANLAICSIGFSPYFFFSIWALFNHATEMTMLASVVPPLAAKLSTIFYPLVYILASARFRRAYAAVVFGEASDANKKSE